MFRTVIVYGVTGLVLVPMIIGGGLFGACYFAEWREPSPNWDYAWHMSSGIFRYLGPISALIGLVAGGLGGYATWREKIWPKS